MNGTHEEGTFSTEGPSLAGFRGSRVAAANALRARLYPEVEAGGFTRVDTTVEFYLRVDLPPGSGGVRSEGHAALSMVIPSMLALASAGVR
jgi:hypothetical protein